MMTVYPLSEGSFTIDSSKIFIPFNADTDDIQQRATGSLLVEVQPFVIRYDAECVLLDAGLGFEQGNGKLQIHNNLVAMGIEAAEVTKVVLSHLHKDHCSGIANFNRDAVEPAFPNATYYVNKKEFEFAMSGSSKSYEPEKLGFLQNNPQVVFTEDDAVIDEVITTKKNRRPFPPPPGHLAKKRR